MFKRLICLLLAVGLVSTFAQAAAAHDPIRVEYTTTDGVKIVGDFWTPIKTTKTGAPLVILLHMYRSDRTAWHPQIVALEYAGFAIMSIDLRGHGESIEPAAMNLAARVQSRDATLFNAMHKDVAGAYEWVRSRSDVDLSRIAIIGASVGCSVALDYAQRDLSVDTVALLSPGTTYLGVDSMAHIKDFGPRHVLLITSEEERARGFDELVSAAKSGGAHVEEKILAGSKIHGTRMYGKVNGIEERIAKFLETHVSEMQGEHVYGTTVSDAYFTQKQIAVMRFKPGVLRTYSSAAEAEQRGLKGRGK